MPPGSFCGWRNTIQTSPSRHFKSAKPVWHSPAQLTPCFTAIYCGNCENTSSRTTSDALSVRSSPITSMIRIDTHFPLGTFHLLEKTPLHVSPAHPCHSRL